MLQLYRRSTANHDCIGIPDEGDRECKSKDPQSPGFGRRGTSVSQAIRTRLAELEREKAALTSRLEQLERPLDLGWSGEQWNLPCRCRVQYGLEADRSRPLRRSSVQSVLRHGIPSTRPRGGAGPEIQAMMESGRAAAMTHTVC
jgi:hypothetical protein